MRFWLERSTIKEFKRQLSNTHKFMEDKEEWLQNMMTSLQTLRNLNETKIWRR